MSSRREAVFSKVFVLITILMVYFSAGQSGSALAGASSGPTGTLTFSATDYGATQDLGVKITTVNRTGGAGGAGSVLCKTYDDTAMDGSDYTAVSRVLTWASGDATPKNCDVPISNAKPFYGNKTFYVELSNPTGAVLGTPKRTKVTIYGGAARGQLSLSSANYGVVQNIGIKIITINRTGGSSGAASVVCRTYDNTAIAGSQYAAVKSTLSWASGDMSAKNCLVSISNVTPFSGSKTFYVELSNAAGAALGTSTKATITIYGDEAASTVSLSAPTYAVAQNAGSLTILVNRTGYAGGRANVAYATVNGTAIDGADYASQRGELKWDYGDVAAKSFVIPISNAKPFAGTKTVAIGIGGAIGAVLGKDRSAIVTINGGAVRPNAGAKISWTQPTHFTNGEIIMNLAGYKIHYGNDPAAMTRVVAINNAATLEYEIGNLAAGTWYFAISAYTANAEESELSSVVSSTI